MEFKNKIKNGGSSRNDRPALKVLKVLGFILLGIGFFLLATFALMGLWNWLMPELFALPTIGFWQALGIFVLAKILFGFGGGGGKSKGGGSHRGRSRSSHGCSRGREFDRWKHYDRFWKDQGEEAFNAYVDKFREEEPGTD